MRVVLDTNVLVSALLKPDGPCGRLLEEYVLGDGIFTRDDPPGGIFARHILESDDGGGLLATQGVLTPLVDERILDEYRDVLSRKKFGFEPALVDDLIDAIEAVAVFIDDAPSIEDTATPEDDRPFLEIAVAGEATVLVTGNAKHFKDTGDVDVMSPGELLALLADDDDQ